MLALDDQGKGPPLLLLHGYGTSRFAWRHWVPDLRRDHRVIVPDLLGHGRSPSPPDAAYGPEGQAGRVVELVRRLDLRELLLVGHSLGGGIALLTAMRLRDLGEGDRLRGLVLIGSAAYRQQMPPFVALARKGRLGRLILALAPKRWLVRRVLRAIVWRPDAITPAVVEGYARPWLDRRTRRAMFETAVDIVPEDLERWTGRYPEIHLPTLLLWGRDDPVVPLDVGTRLARDLPDARLVVLDDCGHIPPDEMPGVSLRAVRDFLAGLDRDRPGGPPWNGGLSAP